MYKRIVLGLLLISSFSFLQAQEISRARKQAIDSLALEKVRDLSRYISIIGDKSTPFSEGNRVIDRAVELFADGSLIGVSSLYKEEIQEFEVRRYFERLMALNYEKVSIKWFNVEYIGDLVRQPDGRYIGVITIFQRFEGVTKDGLIYQDTTKKDITVYVERKQTQIGGRLINFWDVLLGDIRVVETSA
ncbi:MAG: hypothetical protein AAF696_35775 [Bacteroidota bacterium]